MCGPQVEPGKCSSICRGKRGYPSPWVSPELEGRWEPWAVSFAGTAICRNSKGCKGLSVHTGGSLSQEGGGQLWNLGKGSLVA